MAIDQTEDDWIAEQRDTVCAYLEREGVHHRGVGEWPAWHLHPYLALWAIESLVAPGRVGWWAISGDVPTDYVSFTDADHPREAFRHFAREWARVASSMLRGEEPPETVIGTAEQWPDLGDLLKRRCELLRQFAEDDAIWVDEDE